MRFRFLNFALLGLLIVSGCDVVPDAAPAPASEATSSVSSGLTSTLAVCHHAFIIDHCGQSGQINPVTGQTWLSDQRRAMAAQLASLPANARFNVFALNGDGTLAPLFADYVPVNAENLLIGEGSNLKPALFVVPGRSFFLQLPSSGQNPLSVHVQFLVFNGAGGTELIQGQDCPHCGPGCGRQWEPPPPPPRPPLPEWWWDWDPLEQGVYIQR